MKIVHISPNAPYNDYWGYQDNLLPKYQKRLGHDVTIITTNTMHKDGGIIETDCADYVLNDGVRVIRLKRKPYPHRVLTGLASKLDVFPFLCEIKPDFIFFHGLVSATINEAVKYKKKMNPDCVIVQDNHLDYFNGPSETTLKAKIIRAFYRAIYRKNNPYVERVYGVTPWRKKYAENYFRVPPAKTDILIMGADDEKIDFANSDSIRKDIRTAHCIADDDFLIVTGGKIDKNKKIDVLMQACTGQKNVKLLIFGTPATDIEAFFKKLCKENENIIFIGWINSDEVYNYFLAADLVVFPGSHSVLWEQACACKVPCAFRQWEGMDHVNNGGNAMFIDEITVDALHEMVGYLHYTDVYYEMLKVAQSEKTDIYCYSSIAKKSLECRGEE